MTTYSWANALSGDWMAAADWSPAGAPGGFTDDAVIAAAGSYAVAIAAGETIQANSVTVTASGATLSVLGALTLGGTQAALSVQSGLVTVAGSLSGGTAKVSGGTLEIMPGSTISSAVSLSSGTLWLNASGTLAAAVTMTGGTLQLSGSVTLDGATLDGTVTSPNFSYLTTTGATTIKDHSGPATINTGWTNSGIIEDKALALYGSATVNNLAGATLDMAAGSFIVAFPFVENHGLLKMTNPGFVRFDSYLDNYGSVEIDSGTLDMLGGAGYFQGTITVAPGASLDFLRNTYYIDSPDAYKNGATALVNGAVTLDGGMFDLRSQHNTLALADNMLWNSGGFANNGSGGTLTTNGVVTINSPTAALSGYTWNNIGSATLNAGGALSLSNSTLNMIGNAGITVAAGANFTNAGNIWRTTIGGSGPGISTIAGTFSNTGNIYVALGTLRLTGSIGGSGQMRIDQGATLELADGGLAGSNLIQLVNIGATLKLDDNSTVPSALNWFGSGLAAGARIDLAAASDATAVVNGSTLSITPQGGSALDFIWSASLTGLNPGVASDGSDGSVVTLYGQAQASSLGGAAFGNRHAGDVVSRALTLTNTAQAVYSENLDAAVSSAAPGITASGSVTGLAPGASDSTALLVGLNTSFARAISGSATIALTSDGAGIDSAGQTLLAAQTIVVTGTVYAYATASLGGVASVDFGDLHTGQTVSQGVTLTNAAAAGFAENLDATWSQTSSGITGTGSATGLLPGGSAVLMVQAAAASAGALSATAVLAPVSDGAGVDGLGTTALASQTLNVTGAVFNYATATLASGTVDFGVVHVGDKVTRQLTLSNTATPDGYSEALDATLSGGGGAITASGSVSLLAAGSSDATQLAVGLNTGADGIFTASAALALTSDGSGIDSLGTTTLDGQSIAISGTVDNYATAEWQTSAGTLSGAGANATLDLGLVYAGGPLAPAGLDILNAASGLADLLSGSFSISGGGAFTNAGFVSFADLAAGQQDSAPAVTLSAATAGVYSETIVLNAAGSNASGYSGALAPQTLTVTGTVVAPGTFTLTPHPDTLSATLPNNLFIASANALNAGDRIAGGSGANSLLLNGPGAFRLSAPATLTSMQTVQAREGQTGGSGQQTVRLRDGLNVTVNVAAATLDPGNPAPPGITIVGADDQSVINLGTGRDTVYVGSSGETINGGSAAARIFVTAATAGVAIAANGAVLQAQGGGSLTMAASDSGIGAVHLLGGTAYQFTANAEPGLTIFGSRGNDVIAPGDASQTVHTFGAATVVQLTAATAGAKVRVQQGGATLAITGSAGQTATLNSQDSHGIVARLDSAGLTLNLGTASFITGIAAAPGDALVAGQAHQTLISQTSGSTLTSSAAHFDVFQGAAAGLDGDTIGNFALSDRLDITDLNPAAAALGYAAGAGQGVLTISDGSHTAAITFLGDMTAYQFHAAPDGHGGTLIAWHN